MPEILSKPPAVESGKVKTESLVEALKNLHPTSLEVEDLQGNRLVLKCRFKDTTDAMACIEKLDAAGIQHAELGRDAVTGEFINGETLSVVDVFSINNLKKIGEEMGLATLINQSNPETPQRFKRGDELAPFPLE